MPLLWTDFDIENDRLDDDMRGELPTPGMDMGTCITMHCPALPLANGDSVSSDHAGPTRVQVLV